MVPAGASGAAPPRPIDLLDGELYARGPFGTYRWLRENAPVYWDPVNELWGISRYDDVLEIEKRKDVFISSDPEKGYRPNMGADPSLIGLDDPLHAQRRSLVSRRFTPRAVTVWARDIRDTVTALLDAVEAEGTADIVAELAAPLPAMMIGKLLGFGADAWPQLQSWSERTIALGGGPRYFTADGVAAMGEFTQACLALYKERSACPAHDIMSVWTGAEIDGAPIPLGDVVSDGILLLDGGAETTRTVIARTILNLIDHPSEWQRLQHGAPLDVAVEEFIRYVTPVHNMCRRAVEAFDLAGTTIARGDQVLMMYGSANRDPTHFADPEAFDVTRSPNNHLAFGFGTHFCLGAALARLEIRTFFEELVRRVRSFRLVPGIEPVEMPNPFVYGLRAAHVEFEFVRA